MFKKQKIALCIPTVEGVLPGRKPKNKFKEFWEKFTSNDGPVTVHLQRGSRVNHFYRKIHKLKDGKILLRNTQLKVIDVATQKCFKGTDLNSYFYVVTEQYVASIGHDASVYVSKIYKDDE